MANLTESFYPYVQIPFAFFYQITLAHFYGLSTIYHQLFLARVFEKKGQA